MPPLPFSLAFSVVRFNSHTLSLYAPRSLLDWFYRFLDVFEDVKLTPANLSRYLSWTRDERVAVRNFLPDSSLSYLVSYLFIYLS